MKPSELLEMHRMAVINKGEYNETTATLLGFAAALCEEIERLRNNLSQSPDPE